MADKGNYGIEITFGAETATFDKSIKSMDKAIKALRKDITAINGNLKFDSLNKDLLTKKFQDYQQIIKATQAKLENYKTELSKVYDANGKVVNEQEWIRLRGAISETEAELVKLRDQADKLKLTIDNIDAYKMAAGFETAGKNLQQASRWAQDLGNALRPLSLISGAALGGAAKAAIDFESAMAGVKKTVEETPTTTYEQLEKTFREMAKEVPSTASEIANVAEMAGQLGIEADSIENFTKVMIDLGNATDLTATDGAKAVAQFFNIMGHDASEINDIVDNFGAAVTALGNNSATTEESIVYMAKALAAASHTVGMTDQEVLGLATSLSSLGLSAERGGSAMSTIMRKIETDVQTGSEAGMERLAVWGSLMDMTADEFKELWQTDTAQAINNIVKGLNQAKDVGESVYSVLGDVDVSNIRQIDTITRLANGYDRFDEYMAMANDEWEKNTALTIEANRRYQTTESQIKMVRNRLIDIGISLGSTILPIINDLLDKAKPLLDRINAFVQRNGALVVKILAIGTALSPVLLGLSKVLKVGGILATAMSKYIKLGVEATSVLGKIGAAIGVGASGAGLIAGLAGLVVGVGAVAIAWRRAKDDAYQFEQQMNSMNDSMDKSMQSADAEYQARMWQIQGAVAYAEQIDNLIASIENETFSEEENASAKERVKSLLDSLNGALGETVYTFDEQTGQIYKNGDAVDSVTDSYKSLIDEMRKTAWLQAHQEAFQQAFENEAKGYELIVGAVETYGQKLDSIAGDYQYLKIPPDVMQSIQDYATGMGGSIEGITNALMQNEQFMASYRGGYEELFTDVSKVAADMMVAYSEYNDKVAEGTAMTENAKAIQEQYNAVANATAQEFANMSTQMAVTTELAGKSNEELGRELGLMQQLQTEYYNRTGEENTYYAEKIRQIQEAMAANTAAAEQQRIEGEQSVTDQNGFTDDITQYRQDKNIETNDAIETDTNATSDATEAYAKGRADAVKNYVDAMQFAPKYIDIYARVHGLEVLGGISGSGGYNAYRNAGFAASGGYQSGNYNVTVNSSVNVSGGQVTTAQAMAFANQIVETVNEELGKRLRTA